MQPGDLVILPLKSRSALAVGEVKGSYKFRADLPDNVRHTRPVKWLRTDLPRSALGQDLLYSLGAIQTVCRIQRNNAETRIRAVLSTGKDPGFAGKPTDGGGDDADTVLHDLERAARDQIQKHIGQHFKGHDLARLVNALLVAQGYRTHASSPGADSGIDITAGRGPLGFDVPRLGVQVKSSDQPLDVKPLRELQGVLKTFGAGHGLLVSWGGFKASVIQEGRKSYFEVRLWDADDLVDAILEHYDALPADLRAELPLKRIWTLVPAEDSGSANG
jgi:restriction system protein